MAKLTPAEAAYLLCAATSIACAVMLFRGYVRGRSRLLLWSALCFAGLALNNALLAIDKVLFPAVDLAFLGVGFTLWRSCAALLGLSLLIYGLIWDAE
jgi:hypothetical protein